MKNDKSRPMTNRQRRQFERMGAAYDAQWSIHRACWELNALIVKAEREGRCPRCGGIGPHSEKSK